VLDRDGVVDVGSTYEPHLEAIAAARPDLILLPFDQIDGSPVLDELREIAPVAAVPTSEGTDDPAVRYGGTASFPRGRALRLLQSVVADHRHACRLASRDGSP
jgi:ABC-type Fe3+-hydroxamate transport system substrate-binding protein